MSDYRNSEGYADPTPFKAMRASRASRRGKAKFLIEIFLFMTREAGFKVTSRIELEDERTGELFL